MIYKDNNKDDTTGSKLIIIYPVAITQRGASERYIPSRGWVREKGKGVKLGKTMIREKLHTLIQGEMVGKSKGTCTYCKSGLVKSYKSLAGQCILNGTIWENGRSEIMIIN